MSSSWKQIIIKSSSKIIVSWVNSGLSQFSHETYFKLIKGKVMSSYIPNIHFKTRSFVGVYITEYSPIRYFLACCSGVPKVSCPAQSFPSYTAPPPDGAVCHTSPCAAEEGVSREDAEAALQTVWYSQLPRQVSNSILESIEQQDGFSSSGISFKATLQRVFCQQLNPTPNTR